MKRDYRHPDDVMIEASSVASAARRFFKWKARRELAIEALVLTYDDEEAIRLLKVLREEFWSE